MLVNKTNIPMSIAVWLARDEYDHNSNPSHISATSILKPTRMLILNSRTDAYKELDIKDLMPSRLGTAIHASIESSWTELDKVKETLKALNYPEKVINNIVINPNPKEVKDTDIPVYMEIRSFKELLGFSISGKFDILINGELEDFKSCSVYNWINKSNVDSYIKQGSIYKWLNPEIVKEDYIKIQYLFTDWSATAALKDKSYPQSRHIEEKYPLMSSSEIEQFIENKLLEIIRYKDTPEKDLPYCTEEELWQKPTVWKYYKDPTKTARSTKNFTSSSEAYAKLIQDNNIGIVKVVEGEPTRCRYCNVVNSCSQAKQYIDKGRLII